MTEPPVFSDSKEHNQEDERLLLYASYLEEARKFASFVSGGGDGWGETDYRNSEIFKFFGKRTQNIVETIGGAFLSGLPNGKEIDLSQIPLGHGMTLESVKNFFEIYPEIKSALDNNELLQNDLLKNALTKDRWQKFLIDPAMRAANIFHEASLNYPYPPVDWALNTLYGTSYFIAKFGERQAQKNDPALLLEKRDSKSASAGAALVGVFAVIGFILTAATAGVSGPVLIAFGSISIAISHLASFGRAFKKLIHEINTRDEAPETYGYRILDRTLLCAKYGATAAFYTCAAVISIGVVVALVGNPIGLAALSSAMVTIGTVVMTVSIVGGLMRAVTKKTIERIEEKTKIKTYEFDFDPDNELDDGLKVENPVLAKKSRSLIKSLSKTAVQKKKIVGDLHSSIMQHKKTIDSGYKLARHVAKNKQKIVCLHREPLTREKFQTFMESTVSEIVQKKSEVPLYQGIKHHIVKDAKDNIKSLTLQVPKKMTKSNLSEKFIQQASEKYDEIKIAQPQSKEIEATITRHSSDETIFIFLEMMKKEVPSLEMDYCGDPKIVLKMLEASKLFDLEISFDPKDIESLGKNSVPELRDYYMKVQGMSSDEFHDFFDKRAEHKLGDFLDSKTLNNINPEV